jgi:hypothetical protein
MTGTHGAPHEWRASDALCGRIGASPLASS